MSHRLTQGFLVVALASLFATWPGLAQEVKPPETFAAKAQVATQDAGASATVTIQIDRYTEERDRMAMLEALRLGGYRGLLPVLREAPQVGHVEMAGRKVPIRWARQMTTDKGRTISVVTESPLAFVGGSAVDAKPRTGFDLALILMDVDATGSGTGTMAAAARIRPGGATGVQIDDYAEKPITLTVRKSSK